MFIQPVLGFSTTVWFFILCTSPPPCLGLLKRSEGLINEVNFSERTDQCVLISFVRFGSVRKRRLTCEICSLISCSIYQLPFWLKIQFVITHFRFPTLPALRVITLRVWWGWKKILDCVWIDHAWWSSPCWVLTSFDSLPCIKWGCPVRMFIQPVLGFSTTVWFFILCTSPPPCLGLLKRSEGLINEVNFSERTDQCVLPSIFSINVLYLVNGCQKWR